MSRPVGAGADQIPPLPLVHPLTRTPPLTTGDCPDAAFHQTVPADPPPESAAVKVSVLVSR
ncbi:hypothetical protein ACFWOB_35275 [Streptomyces sp. NPDC058420]|uniref:hypothetical protein n=1 Tax=Streptomyces sp. NPDC058420 TaxID=3346489 RepID=UPI00364F4559